MTKSKGIESLSAAEARKALAESEARLKKVQERLDAIHPPVHRRAPAQASVNAPKRDPLEGSGEAYRATIEAGDPKELAGLTREREQLTAERELLQHRRDLLRDRAKDAQAEEERKAAPKREREAAAALPEAAQAVLAARETFDAAREELEAHIRQLKQARKLTQNESAALDLDPWLLVESAARCRITAARPTMLRVDAGGGYVGEAGVEVEYPALPLDLLGTPDAPSLWPRWLRARESMSPRERASSMVPHDEESVRRVAKELARRALVQNPPDKRAFHAAWSAAEEVVEEQKAKDAKDAKKREALERAKAKDDGWINQRSRDRIVK